MNGGARSAYCELPSYRRGISGLVVLVLRFNLGAVIYYTKNTKEGVV